MTPEVQTLTQRLAAGRLPLPDALRYALQLIDALRHAHEEGHCHGALTPDSVILNSAGVELVPAQPGAVDAITPYTAPERLNGHPPDISSDIFSCGAILYEIFSGHRAFEPSDAHTLQDAIENSTPAPIGDTALDRLVFNCLAKDPAARWQRVQQLQMEVKILMFSAGRMRAASAPRPPALATADVRQIESKLTSRLDQHEEAMAGLKHAADSLPLLESRLMARLEEHYGEVTSGVRHLAAEFPLMESRFASRAEQHRGAAAASFQQLAAELPPLASRLEKHEDMLAGLRKSASESTQMESRLQIRMGACDEALAGFKHLSSELPRLDYRLTTRLENQETALAALRDAMAENSSVLQTAAQKLNAAEEKFTALETQISALRERTEQSGQMLVQKLDAHHDRFAALESQTSSIHERAANAEQVAVQKLGAAQEQAAALEAQIQSLRERAEQVDQAATQKLDSAHVRFAALETQTSAVRERVEHTEKSAAEQLSAAQEHFTAMDAQLRATHERAEKAEQAASQIAEQSRNEAASLQISLLSELQTMEQTVKTQGAAIESIRGAMARTDDFMERVVEALESLQTMVLERAAPTT